MKTSHNNCTLIVPQIKYVDYMNQTTAYLAKVKLSEKAKVEITHRINSLGKSFTDTLAHYAHGKPKQSPKAYAAIESGIKEILRRIRISLAVNKKHSKEYIGFWKHLSELCLEDAALLRDLYLLSVFESFHESTHKLKAK
ncbi:MAG: hypothetical protein IT236_09270 [Bacteroidia bacterium]|nr:hypothetical protein [Bacteroidia bacterium]